MIVKDTFKFQDLHKKINKRSYCPSSTYIFFFEFATQIYQKTSLQVLLIKSSYIQMLFFHP